MLEKTNGKKVKKTHLYFQDLLLKKGNLCQVQKNKIKM